MSVLELTLENFQEEVLKSEMPVLVDFWAPWCMPCKMYAPIVEDVADEFDGKVKVCKVNIDEQLELATTYSILSIPTTAVFQNGKLMDTLVGARTRKELTELLLGMVEK